MNENLTEIICVLDRSGSMTKTKEDAIGGFNTFLEEQKEVEGEATMTLVLFDTAYDIIEDGTDIQEVSPLDDTTFVPRGMTALYDAVGRTIDSVGVRLSKTAEKDRPGKVIFVILTDGAENSSREYTGLRIKDMITHQSETYQWEFLFLGANINAELVAGDMGIAKGSAVTYTADSHGTHKAYNSVGQAVRSYRMGGAVDPNWSGAIAPDGDDDGSDTDTSAK